MAKYIDADELIERYASYPTTTTITLGELVETMRTLHDDLMDYFKEVMSHVYDGSITLDQAMLMISYHMKCER
jgi:hypothetical protein